MDEREQVIEKIKKLLRMKRGGTPAEIETALGLAAELARKHGIDLGSVDPDTEQKRITHVEELLKSRMPAEARFAAAILVNFFNVQVILHEGWERDRCFFRKRQYKLVLVGTAWDCEVARYVFAFLQGAFRRAWSGRENRRLKNRYAFLCGMFLALAAKLEERRKVETGKTGQELMVVNGALKAYVREHFPEAKDSPLEEDGSDAWQARWAGAIAGRNTEIRSAVKEGTRPARAALPPAAGQLELI